MRFKDQVEASKAHIQELKKVAPYVFPEYQEFQNAKRDLEKAKERFEKAQKRWEAL